MPNGNDWAGVRTPHSDPWTIQNAHVFFVIIALQREILECHVGGRSLQPPTRKRINGGGGDFRVPSAQRNKAL